MNPLEARRRLLGRNVYKKTTEGNPAIAQGSLARMYPGIVMQGWTTQDGTPTPETPVPIVSAGTQNQETGKWEYEITIANAQTDATKNQTVTLTADRPLTKWDRLEKRNGQWGWTYKNAEITLEGGKDENWMSQSDTSGKMQFYIPLRDALYPYTNPFDEMFYCNTFFTTNALGTIPNWQVRKGTYNGLAGLAPVFKPGDDIDTIDLFRAFLAENPTTILYVTKEETFVPLSESEQQAMNALYTFRPTTVLSNDCECNMALTYKTKKSLENLVGGGIRKADGIISEFVFGVKWNQIDKIVLKASGITSTLDNMFFCSSDITTPYIAIDNTFLIPLLNEFNCNFSENQILNGEYHEIVFTFDKPTKDMTISNVWDARWSKNIIYHEIMFYDGENLLADYVPYYKGAGYMLDKVNHVVIEASDPESYQFA